MPIRKTVRRADSLWSLSNRYLGSGARYPQILDFHNQEAARYGLRTIDNEDLIFVGETILIPSRPKQPTQGTGTRAKGGQWPIPPNVKPTYVIGRDTPPVRYVTILPDYTIHTEMTGEIGIENITPGHSKYVHNFELWMSKSPEQAKSKLRYVYDPAVAALTAKPEAVFESGRVKIKAPIASKANLGPLSVEVQAVSPLQMTGIFKLQAISGKFDLGRYKYKYTADIGFNVDVIWKQKPVGDPETVKVSVKDEEQLVAPSGIEVDWGKVSEFADELATVVFIAIITIFVPETQIPQPTKIFMPMYHTIDTRRHGYPGDA